jgi:hypothetical protein
VSREPSLKWRLLFSFSSFISPMHVTCPVNRIIRNAVTIE